MLGLEKIIAGAKLRGIAGATPVEVMRVEWNADSNASRTAFRRIADRIPNDRGQRSDDRGQWWMIG